MEDHGNALGRLTERVAALEAAAAEGARAPSDLAAVHAQLRDLQDAKVYEASDQRQILISSSRLVAVFKAQGAAPVLEVLRVWMLENRTESAAAALRFYF